MHYCKMTAVLLLVVSTVYFSFDFYEGFQVREMRRLGMRWSDIFRPRGQTQRELVLGVIGLVVICRSIW